jgi:hypothetical protein
MNVMRPYAVGDNTRTTIEQIGGGGTTLELDSLFLVVVGLTSFWLVSVLQMSLTCLR